MQRNLLTSHPNLLSRVNRSNEKVFLKKNQVLEKNTLQSLFRSPNGFKQLSLRSRSEVVFLDLDRVLQLSPLLSKLVGELRECCFNPHDQVDICLDQFSPGLLNIVKHLLEKGECNIISESEKEQLEDLIQALGMDETLQLLNCPIEKSSMTLLREGETSIVAVSDDNKDMLENKIDVADHTIDNANTENTQAENGKVNKMRVGNIRKRKSNCEKTKWVVKQPRCNNNTINQDTDDGLNQQNEGEIENNQKGEVKNEQYVETSERKSTRKRSKLFRNYEEVGDSFSESEDVQEPNWADDSPSNSQIDETEDYLNETIEDGNAQIEKNCLSCGKKYKKSFYLKQHKQVCPLRKYEEESVFSENGDQGENSDVKSCTIRERKKCPSCDKMLFVKGIGSKYDQHVSKCLKTDQSDSVSKKKEERPKYEKHVSKCQNETFQSDKAESSKTANECQKCGKRFKIGGKGNDDYFVKHIQKCQFEKSKPIDHSRETEEIPCPNACGKRFSDREALKPHSENCPVKEDDNETTPCQLCGHGDFNEKDLMEHLYRKHEDLKRQIKKSAADNFSNPVSFYSLEKLKKNCECPICGEKMKATRNTVGLHWALEHKKIMALYNSEIQSNSNMKDKNNQKKRGSQRGTLKVDRSLNSNTDDPNVSGQSNSSNEFEVSSLKDACLLIARLKEPENNKANVKNKTNNEKEEECLDGDKEQGNTVDYEKRNENLEEMDDEKKSGNLVEGDRIKQLDNVEKPNFPNLCISNVKTIDELRSRIALTQQKSKALKEKQNKEFQLKQPLSSASSEQVNQKPSSSSASSERVNEKRPLSSASSERVNEKRPSSSASSERVNEKRPSSSASGSSEQVNDKRSSSSASSEQVNQKPSSSSASSERVNQKRSSSSASSEQVNDKRPHGCSMDIIVDNLKDMDALGTSILRREATQHKVLNSSGKQKLQVVEELWEHYLKFHPTHLKFQYKENQNQVGLEPRNNEPISVREQIFGDEFSSDTD